MKFPLSWLKEHIDTQLTPDQIAETLTQIGLEVDAITPAEMGFQGIVIGEVMETSPHPQADHLTVAKVSDGKEVFTVVCGASNCRPGIKVPFAKIGATLTDPDGNTFTIKPAKLRGVASEGMLCAHEELGLSEGTEGGILELSETSQVGQNVAMLYADLIFEISLTPNLAHCLSLSGIARELAAVTQEPLITTSIPDYPKNKEKPFPVTLEATEGCPRYGCRVIKGIKVAPSPQWLSTKLELAGIRSINNIVDATNYVLLEMGHPLHAFDLDQLTDKVVIRHAQKGETLKTLDEQERPLTEETVVICDAKKPVAVAGVMGGEKSEVNDTTTNILLEGAYFNPPHVRRASKKLGLHTEASHRFERGVDPNTTLEAIEYATSLICQLAGGTATEVVDLYPTPIEPKTIICRTERINQLLGTQLAISEVETLLKRLGLKILDVKGRKLTVQAPTYRHDILEEIDLIEEVARLYGYNNLHTMKKSYYTTGTLDHSSLFLFERAVKTALLREGLQELLTCNLISPSQAALIAPDGMPSRSLIKILSARSVDQSILRPSLLPNMLSVTKLNIDHHTTNLAAFEIGKIHFKTKETHVEPTVVSIVLTGQRHPSHWESNPQPIDFFDLKGHIETLLHTLHIKDFAFTPSSYENFHPNRQATLMINGIKGGSLGEVHPATLKKLDLTTSVFFAEINLDDMQRGVASQIKMQPLAQYPSVIRDWTLTLKETVLASEVTKWVDEYRPPDLESVEFIKLFHHEEKLGTDWKNITFRLTYRDRQKTLSIEEVNVQHETLIQKVMDQLKKETKVR